MVAIKKEIRNRIILYNPYMIEPELQKNATGKFAFFSSENYYYDLIKHIGKAKKGDRVVLATMAFQPDQQLVCRLLDTVHVAARRGVTVRMMVDAFPFIVKEGASPGPLLVTRNLPRYMTKTFRIRLESLERLRAYGGEYHIINHPRRLFSPPFAGRSHIKFAIINDTVYIGGCNLANTDHIDLMVRWSDARTANWLCSLEEQISKNGQVSDALNRKDLIRVIDRKASLMIDAGVPNQSLIFDKALALIDSAQRYITITCQFLPNDITIRRLAAASVRGVNVMIIYNHPSKHLFPFNFLHQGVVWSEMLARPPHLFANQLSKKHNFMHAKLLVTDQGTIIGSHNYVRAGVTFGTAEIALFSTDRQFGSNAMRQLVDLQLLTTPQR